MNSWRWIRGLPAALSVATAALIILTWYSLPSSALPGLVGLLVCGLLGVNVAILRQSHRGELGTKALQTFFSLARDQEISARHEQLLTELLLVSERRDPIFREHALKRLSDIHGQLHALADGRIEFTTTESWRIAYEELLRSPGLYQYRSVAHVETPHYWQDGPGRLSTQLNFDLQEGGVLTIERIVIIADHLWPAAGAGPEETVHNWIDEQSRHGIPVGLIRESALQPEPQLIADFGIYGHRAVGRQQLDAAGRTTRFVLSFDLTAVSEAEQLWQKLAVYAVPYRKALDRAG